ncbi:YfjI family protein [Acidobacteria bacterium AH-259-O06]|nr:YfjI family protein [Acidobacteria bacterium AH-259-O06]
MTQDTKPKFVDLSDLRNKCCSDSSKPAPKKEAPKREAKKAKSATAAPPEHLPADLKKDLKVGSWSTPHKGFIKDYLRWAVPRTEAPLGFHLAAAIVGLGIILGRKCKIVVGDLTFHPNIYSVSVGISTLVRKTHAINMLRRILQKVKKILKLPHGFFLADDGTPEGLLTELHKKKSGIKAFQEFGDFLKQTKKRDYLGGFAGLFTELYDCPEAYSKQLSQDGFKIKEPFLCILGATTREWLVEGMSESDIQSGFLARFLLFPGNEETKLLPITPKRDTKAEEQLAKQLAELSKISGIFEPTEKAKQVYSDWYTRHRRELKKSDMGLLSPYYGRLEGYVWKIAFIFEATADPDLKSISADSVQLAINFVERLKQDLKPLILKEFQPGYWAKKVHKVRVLIQDAGSTGISRSRLLQYSHLKTTELTEVLAWLGQTKEIKSCKTGTGAIWYVAVQRKDS